MKIALTGATGFIGKALCARLLADGHEVRAITRDPEAAKAALNTAAYSWDDAKQAIDGTDAVIHLAGDNVAAGRWTAAKKSRIHHSRIKSTRAIVGACKLVASKPSVLINASAIGYYGNAQAGDITERHPAGSDFLAEVCKDWEAEVQKLNGIREVRLRIGIVLEQGGGAFQKMSLPFRFFIGGHLGSGQNPFPWIHRDDVLGLITQALSDLRYQGPINLVAPESVTLKEFCKTLGRVLRRPSWAHVPGFMLRLLVGDMAEMLLGGVRVVPAKARELGYAFKFPELKGALEAIIKS